MTVPVVRGVGKSKRVCMFVALCLAHDPHFLGSNVRPDHCRISKRLVWPALAFARSRVFVVVLVVAVVGCDKCSHRAR